MVRRLVALAMLVGLALPGYAAAQTPAPDLPPPPRGPNAVLFVADAHATDAAADAAFAPLQAELVALGWQPRTFLRWSWHANELEGCTWRSLPWTTSATSAGVAGEVARLAERLRTFQRTCPDAGLALVGHGVGGLVAFLAAAEPGIANVDGVAVVQSPLGGIPRAILDACPAGLGTLPCEAGKGPLHDELASMWASGPEVAARNQQAVAALAARGVNVTLFGNQADCLYMPALCDPTWSGDLDARETQWWGLRDTPGVSWWEYDSTEVTNQCPPATADLCIGPSHEAVLLHLPQAWADLANWVGPPDQPR